MLAPTASRRLLSAGIVFLVLSAGVLRSGMAGEGVQELPRLPSAPSALFVDKGGHLYALLATQAQTLDLKADRSQWEVVDLAHVTDLTVNQEGRVFARCALGASHVFYELRGSSGRVVLEGAPFTCDAWYVDGANRVWLQSEEKLIIASAHAEPQVVTRSHGPSGFRLRKPCEWQPGHVVLFYGTAMVWAGPESIEVRDAPRFAADGTGNGPLRLGDHFLVSGGGNNIGFGSYVIDTRAPEDAPRRVWLGWDWFHGVASAPDGRALVLAQTDRDPKFTLFWYAVHGMSDVRLKGAEDVLRAGLSRETLSHLKIAFNSRGVAFVALTSGVLGVLDTDTASVVTPFLGLPVEQLVDLAALDDDLMMVGADGRVVLWDTRVPLTPLSTASFDAKGEWTLAGPCCVDASGKMWAFLADFPGKLSCYDGTHWEHVPIELGNRQPQYMTADDLGNLQISFQHYFAGSCLYTSGRFQFWSEGSTKAWCESLRLGARRFFDGSGFRTRHWTDGSGKGWFYDGRILCEGTVEANYFEHPPYTYWWVDADKGWYRLSGTRAMVYRNGRWRTPKEVPQRLHLDSRGLRTSDGKGPDVGRVDDLPVDLRNGTAYVLSPHGIGPGYGKRKGGLFERQIGGDVIFQASGTGGGWVGRDRYILGVFPVSSRGSKVYEAECGRFLLEAEGQLTKLRLHRPRDLTITGEVTEAHDQWSVSCKVAADPPPDEPCVVVEINGVVTGTPAEPNAVRIPVDPYREQLVALYAVDRLGDISLDPLILRVKYPLDFPLPVHDGHRPRWRVLPKQVSKSGPGGNPLVIGRYLASDPDGNMWMTTSEANSLLGYAPATGKCELVQAPGPLVLVNSPDGRAWGLGAAPRGPGERSLHSVSSNGIEYATSVYYDRESKPGSIAWDTEGNLWACALRWVGRWDGAEWKEWERPVGYGAQILTGVGGSAVVLCEEGFLVYAHEELSDFRTLPDGWRFRQGSHLLSNRYLVGPCERQRSERGEERATGIYDLESGDLDVSSLPRSAWLRPDRQGNLYIWEHGKERFFLLRGDDKRQLGLLYCPPPAWEDYVGERTFFRTKDGVLICLRSPASAITWTEEYGPQEYTPPEGIAGEPTWAVAEDALGRVWMVRDSHLLLFDPEGQPEGE